MKLASGIMVSCALLLGALGTKATAQIAVGQSGVVSFTAGQAEHAIAESTLDQPGTPPFHLLLQFSPRRAGVASTDYTGTVEYWWVSPTQWRREIKSGSFHDVEVRNNANIWEKHEGDFFPVWLQEIAKAAVQPVPLPAKDLATGLSRSALKYIMGTANFQWPIDPAIDDQRMTNKAYVQFEMSTGLMNYTGGPDWNGEYKDFQDFHGKPIARQVSVDEAVGKVAILEDLVPPPAGFFDAAKPGGDAHPIETIVLDTDDLRKNLVAEPQFAWPDMLDGPFEGEVFTSLIFDQSGKVRHMGYTVADNEGVRAAAIKGFQTLTFKPFIRDGVPVQVIGRYAVQFKAHRPAGVETFAAAKTYLDRANTLSFLHSAGHKPYHLTSTVVVFTPRGPATGTYEETWLDPTHHRQDLTFGAGHLVRTMNGDKVYQLAEGSADGAATGSFEQIIRLTSPVMPTNGLVESDWCVRRGTGEDKGLIGVIRCSPNDQGGRDLLQSAAYWVNDKGEFVRAFAQHMEIRAKNPQPYDGANLPRELDVYTQDRQVMTITVTQVEPADPTATVTLDLPGYEVNTHLIPVPLPPAKTSN